MNNELLEFLNSILPSSRSRKILKKPEYIDWLNKIYPGVKLNNQIHSFMKGTNPYCLVCNHPVKFLGKITCSHRCYSKYEKEHGILDKRLEKAKSTNIERYGSENPASSSIIQEKRLITMDQKYGAKVSPKAREASKDRAQEFNRKAQKTLHEKYNVTNSSQLPNHLEKCRLTSLERYGSEHYTQSVEFIKKCEDRRLDAYLKLSPMSITINSILDDSDKSQIFDDPNKVISFKCTCGYEDSVPSETYKWRIRETSTPCIKCSGLNKGSKKEKEVMSFIESLGFIVDENKKILDGKEIDIYIKEKNIGIEFDGLFYHSKPEIDKKYHLNKTDIAKLKGIKLIHIFEDEWDYKKDIVKSRLETILGVIKNKLFARKCQIKEISTNEARIFVNENHIQGYANSSIKIGLFFNNVLCSVMTFSIPNISKGQKFEENFWELSRFCSEKNTTVVGGASKLLKYFEVNFSPKKLLSFADKRWSTGELYSILGFTEQKDTPINYWYILGDKRIHRFSLRKNKDDDQSLSENENRIKQGYRKIWDCGNKKFIKFYCHDKKIPENDK